MTLKELSKVTHERKLGAAGMIEKDPDETKAQYWYDRHEQQRRDAADAAIKNSGFALRTLVLINGGAAIAYLAFIGNLVSTSSARTLPNLARISEPLVSFAWGVGWATLAIGLAYFSTYCIAANMGNVDFISDHPWVKENSTSERWGRFGIVFEIAAVLVAFASLWCFITGMLDAREALILEYSSRG